jgi:tRNA pseudouridine32 synthase / 23S rRNA pseudouridine746 synthase
MALYRPNPPADRHGVSASCVVTQPGPWATVFEFLVARFPRVASDTWQRRLQQGDVVDDAGQTITPYQVFQPGQRLYYFRAIESEAAIPFEAGVLWQNEHLLVADKPHFLPVLPSGKYLQETLLTRLKNTLGLADLSPIHRIDRDTAGLVLFSIQRNTRDAYQALFRARKIHKTYEAIARWNPNLPWPLTRETRLAPSAHFMQQEEIDGPPNTLTHIKPLEVLGEFARYELKPVTGHRHQLRVHMNALGLPILGDGIYPVLTPEGHTDTQRPLQLLAKAITFTDPLSGLPMQFESRHSLFTLTVASACFGNNSSQKPYTESTSSYK